MIGEVLDIEMGGYRFSPGEHVCALYATSAERDAVLRSFVRSALMSGNKCICVLDPPKAMQMRQVVTSVGDDDDIDLPACVASRQLELASASDTIYPSGRFSAADMLGYLKMAVAGVMKAGEHQCLCAIGEHSSFLRDVSTAREVIRFESQLESLLPLYPQVLACLYNLDDVGGAFLVDLVMTHHKVILREMLVENPHHLTPEEWTKQIGGGP